MTTYRLGSATIHHGEGQTVTVLSDGRETRANWMVQDGRAATAEQYGIPLDRLNRDHDLAHAILAAVLGLPESPTLAGVASGHYWPAWFREEAAVLAFCGYAAAAGVDMEQVAARLADGHGSRTNTPAAPSAAMKSDRTCSASADPPSKSRHASAAL